MGLTMLRMDSARTRWRLKLERAFAAKAAKADNEGKRVKYLLFSLPFVTVLREGLEAVVFIGGVRILYRPQADSDCSSNRCPSDKLAPPFPSPLYVDFS
jgi:high-affinity Fe2+/Pb2+ permease